MTLTKAQLVDKIFQTHGLSKTQSSDAVELFLETIKNCLEKNEDVLITSFGKFKVKQKNPRRGHNPQTGEKLIVKGRKVVVFYWSRKLREKINK